MPLREQEGFVCRPWGRAGVWDHRSLGSRPQEPWDASLTLGSWELEARKQLLTLNDLSMSYLTLFTFYLKNGFWKGYDCVCFIPIGIYQLEAEIDRSSQWGFFGCVGTIFIRSVGTFQSKGPQRFASQCQDGRWSSCLAMLCIGRSFRGFWVFFCVSSAWEGRQLFPFYRWGNSKREGKWIVQSVSKLMIELELEMNSTSPTDHRL